MKSYDAINERERERVEARSKIDDSKLRKKYFFRVVFLFVVFLGGFLSFSAYVNAATNVYYSVGQLKYNDTGGNLMASTSGALHVTIASGVATFDTAQTGNIGVGDRVTYNTSSVVYISGRTSQTVWNVITATGTIPANISNSSVVSIGHEYKKLNDAFWGAYDSSHTNGLDLTATSTILNIPCYYDNGPDANNVSWPTGGYITSATSFIRIYTPTSTAEVNHSQRHTGKWTSTAYELDMSGTSGVGIPSGVNFLRIDGLQIKFTTTATNKNAITAAGKLITDATDIQISNNIIQGVISGATTGNAGIYGGYWASPSNNTARVWNNIVYGFTNGGVANEIGIEGYGVDMYAYNNTIYGSDVGMDLEGTSKFIAKNNIVQNSINYGYRHNTNFTSSSTNNISDRADAPGSNPKNSTTTVFVNTSTSDFHLASNDTAAIDKGVSLSADTALPFSTDIDGQARPYGSAWDIGADEYQPAAATTYTFIGPTGGTINNASTNFTVTPNGIYNGAITITPTGGFGLSPVVLNFVSSATPQTFTITPTAGGTITLTTSNNGGLTDASNLAYVVATVPAAPTGVSAATSSPNQATVSFTPGSNGGSTILYYLASSTPGNFTATSTGSPIVVTGLTNNTSYTFAVYAVNAVGTSSPSSASNVVTPTAALATTYTFVGPSSGNVGSASSIFTVTPNGAYTGAITITPTGGFGLSPVVLNFVNSATPQTLTITPTVAGSITLTPTNNGSLSPNPANLTYTANGPVNVYYSVGQLKYNDSGGNLMTGSPTVNIASGVATFSTSQTGNIGIGDRVTYNGSTIAYLSGRTSQTVWNVVTATGTVPANVSGVTVNSIGHEYNSLNAGVWGAYDSSHTNGLDLTASNLILNIPCYYDNGPDTVSMVWPTGGYVTSATNYVRIYTPTSTAEVNHSQRHTGKWTANAYRREVSADIGIRLGPNFIRIDGLQIQVTASTTGRNGISGTGKLITDATDIQISNNIVKGILSGGATDNYGIDLSYWPTQSNNTAHVWNNVVYGFANGTTGRGIAGYNVDLYAYNNTMFNDYTGIRRDGVNLLVAKNNIVQNSTIGYSGTFAASSTNNISDNSSVASSTADHASAAVAFADSANNDFHLVSGDTVAKDAGVNLSADTAFPFNTDIDGQARPYESSWDIGADEMYPSSDVTAPIVDTFTMPTTATNFTVSVTAFTGHDDVAVAGYLITESASTPLLTNTNWSSTSPATFTFTGAGTRTAYAWIKDTSGNISSSASQPVNITLATNTYYVDAAGGDDSNTGTSTDHAWQTVAKVNSATFQPGDHVLFKRGQVWREQLTIPSSGIANYPVVFDTYGTGATSTISAANAVTGWTNYSGNIYVANVGSITTPTQLYVDNTFYDIAHYPDSGYLLATANSVDATSIIDSNLTLTSGQVVGATVMSKAVPWFISSATSTAYDSGTHTITLAAPVDSQSPSQIMRTGYGFYLQNMLWMLDQPGEWYYDSTAGKLYLWTTNGDDPTSHTVEVASRPYGIYNNGNNYVTIQNLAVTNANQYYDVYVNNANNITLNNLSVLGGQVGIYASGLATSSIQNNSIKNALVEGIYIPYGSNISITSNTVSNTGTAGITPKESEAGIYVGGTSLNVDSNTVTNSGYGGILFSGNLNIIQNNHIDRSCLVLDDCGGIYTFSNNELAGWTDIIRGNTITNTMGSASGKPQTYTAGNGIYLDEKTHGFSVLNNIIYNADSGIHINNGYSNTISGNSVYAARIAGFSIVEANYGYAGDVAGVIHDNLVTGNTFETIAGPSAYSGIYNGAVSYYSTFGSTAAFGTYDHNQYCHPNESWAVANRIVNIGQVDNYTLPDWQTYSGQDLNSTETSSSCSQPSITTSAASPVSTSTVTLNGNISSNGYASSTIRGFAYGTAADLSTVIATTTESGTFGTGTFTANISSLTASTTYYFRAYSVNTAGTSTGAILSTTTLQLSASVPDAPTGASAATSSPNQATVSFTPGSNGGSTILYYLASSTPGNFTATSTGSPIVVTGLTNNTSYTFAVYAVNAVGTSSPSSASNAVTPKAATVAPTLTTSAASSVSTSTATLNAHITATGGADATQSGFAYGTVADLSTVIATTTLNGQTGTATFNQTLTNLTPNTTYYFRAYAVNSAGTSTGSILSFATTDTTPPTVAMTVPASGATVNGSSVTLTATASDDVGVSGVQFKLDGTTNIGSEITSTSSPNTYTTTWDSTGITIYGSHTLYAVARDAAGNHSTSTVSVNVDNVAPIMQSVSHDSDTQITVTLSKLASSTTITKSNDGGFTVTKTGTGTTYAVSSIATGSDNTKVVLIVASMTAAGGTGVTVTYSHSGNGTITDTLGNVLATNGTGIAIPPWNTTAPIISNITSTVTDGPYIAGATIDIDLTFSKAVNTSGTVTVTLNTGGTCTFSGVSNSTTASCNYTVGGSDNTSRLNVSSVSGTITSTDSNPMTSFAPAVNLSVNKNIVIDTIAPSVSLDVPTNGSTVSGTAVTLTANASDSSSGLAGVQFKLDGANIGTEGLATSPYSITWNSKTTTSASHTLQAVSRDVAGNYATSSITVTVENTAPGVATSVTATAGDAQASVSFLAPADNGGATITGYTVISNPSGGTDGNAGTTALTHTVTGLVNNTAYTFTVTATNSNGTSNPSDPSTPVTPVGSVLPTYTIGGTVSGLSGTVVLQNNSVDNKSISSNGSFIFATGLHNADAYSVIVLTQPYGQTCSVGSGSGTVSSANVTSVFVSCSDNPVTPTPVTTSYSSGGGGGSFYVVPKAVATTTATTTTPTTCKTLMYPVITKQLSLGMTGNDVVLLQKILTLERFFTTNSTSGTYGPQTTVAVSSFQKKNNIVISGTPETTGFGNVGPKTQAFINKLISQGKYPTLGQCVTSAPVLNTPTKNVSSYTFTRSLTLGSTGSDVKALQVFLNSQGFAISSSGAGSPGNETTYFGPATKTALMKFQEYYAKDVLVPNGLTKGTGFFGAATMRVVNRLMK